MSELSEFFEQILHTERSLSSRNVKLRKLKEEIQACVVALQQVSQETEAQQGELAVRNVKMVDHEVEAKLLELRQTILEEQNSKLTTENQALSSEMEVLKLQLESDTESFLGELKEFGRSYDLVGAGCKHREELAQKRVGTLQDELLLLEAELAEFESEKEEARRLEKKLLEVEQRLIEKQELKKTLECKLLEDQREVELLKAEHEASSSKLSDDPEIIRLQKELEECRDCPEERECHSLQTELEELQRLCYHKQMKEHMSRRKSYRGSDQSTPYKTWHGGGGGGGGGGVGTGEGRRSTERGDVEEEGWDDEMEAAELASFQESLSVSDMEWAEEDEGEVEREEQESSVGSHILETEDQENREGVGKYKQDHFCSKVSSGAASLRKQHKYSFVKQRHHASMQPTSKALQRAVWRGGDSAHLATVTDSPMPGTMPPRKSSGQSIYKAPGQYETLRTGVPKTAKKVRFRY